MFHPVIRYMLGIYLIAVGLGHFLGLNSFIRVVPDYIPFPSLVIYLTGFFEIFGGIGLLLPFISRTVAILLLFLFAAVFPSNLHMAIHNLPTAGFFVPSWILWAKIPIQLVLIGWAIWMVQSGAKTSKVESPQEP